MNEENGMFVARILRIVTLTMLALAASPTLARDVIVGDIAALDAALRESSSGDVIILRPGRYKMDGGDYKYLFGNNLKNVTIRSQDPANPAIIDGDNIGRVVLFRSPQKLVIQDLIIQNMTEGGLNIDDNDDRGAYIPQVRVSITRNLRQRSSAIVPWVDAQQRRDFPLQGRQFREEQVGIAFGA